MPTSSLLIFRSDWKTNDIKNIQETPVITGIISDPTIQKASSDN